MTEAFPILIDPLSLPPTDPPETVPAIDPELDTLPEIEPLFEFVTGPAPEELDCTGDELSCPVTSDA